MPRVPLEFVVIDVEKQVNLAVHVPLGRFSSPSADRQRQKCRYVGVLTDNDRETGSRAFASVIIMVCLRT